MSILRLTSDGGRPTANEHSPSPRSPTWACPSSLVVAPHRGGCGFCHGLGWTRRSRHLPVLAGELVLLVGPAADDVPDRLLPHAAALGRVDAEALELGPGGRAPGAEVDPAAREQVEHGHRLGRAHRVVVGLGHEAHAVAEPDALGARRDGAVEHLGVRAVRVLLQEVVLDRPEGVPAEAVAGDGLFERVAVGDELAVGLPGTRDGDLVEQGELHGVGSPRGTMARGRPGLELDLLLSARLTRAQPTRRRRCHARTERPDLHRHRRRLGHRAGHGGPAARGGSPGHGGRPRRAAGRPRRRRRRGSALGLHPGRRHRRGSVEATGAGRRRLRRDGRGPGQRGRRGRRRPGPPAARAASGPASSP